MSEAKETKNAPVLNDHVLRVTYRDTDRMGVVYYANYLVWFEIGRTELLRQAGHTYSELEEKGLVLPVIHCRCDYKKPARYDDLVRVRTRISRLSRAGISFHYQVFREETGELLAEGETRHPLVDKRGRIVRTGHILKEWFGVK